LTFLKVSLLRSRELPFVINVWIKLALFLCVPIAIFFALNNKFTSSISFMFLILYLTTVVNYPTKIEVPIINFKFFNKDKLNELMARSIFEISISAMPQMIITFASIYMEKNEGYLFLNLFSSLSIVGIFAVWLERSILNENIDSFNIKEIFLTSVICGLISGIFSYLFINCNLIEIAITSLVSSSSIYIVNSLSKIRKNNNSILKYSLSATYLCLLLIMLAIIYLLNMHNARGVMIIIFLCNLFIVFSQLIYNKIGFLKYVPESTI
jgi:hypothetical protein